MAVQNTHRSYIGVAKEATEGTAVAPTAFIPVTASKLKVDNIIDPLFDEGLRGSLVKDYNYIQGRSRSTIDFGGPVFADTFGWILGAHLGSVTTTGASAPYTHAITVKNLTAVAVDAQPTSLTFTDFYAANNRQYPGCSISDVTVNFSAEGLLEYDAKAMGWLSASATATTPSWNTVQPTPVWQGVVTISGTQITNAVEGSITMTRPVTPIYGIGVTSGSAKNPYSIFQGALEVKGQLRFVMEADTQLTTFLAGATVPISIDWSNGGSGTALTQVKATLSAGAYTVAVIDRSKDFVEIVIDITGIGNTTDAAVGYSPIKWTLQNAIASGVYQ
jgi:hypothetical protein